MLITVIRHAQAEHNVYKNRSHDKCRYLRDPNLTELGKTQARNLNKKIYDIEQNYIRRFNKSECRSIILSSPMKRALETLELGFPNNDNIHIIQELQGPSILPCDMGSCRSVLEKDFPCLDFSNLDENWWYLSKFENNDDRIEKIKTIISYLFDKTNYDNVILISHEGILHNFFGLMFNPCEVRTYYMIDNKTIIPINLN